MTTHTNTIKEQDKNNNEDNDIFGNYTSTIENQQEMSNLTLYSSSIATFSPFNHNCFSSSSSLSSEGDGIGNKCCLQNSSPSGRKQSKTTATFEGFLTASSSTSTNSLGGKRIYDPATSPSIIARRRSKSQQVSMDSNHKSIDDYVQIHCIEKYIPTITNNSMKYIRVTLKIDSFIKGFESDVLTDCLPLENECISPTLVKSKKKEKPQFASVVVSKKNCKSMKHLETIYKTLVLSPNSNTNLTPNSCEESSSFQDENDLNSVKNVKKHYTYEILSRGFVKGISSPCQSDLVTSTIYEQDTLTSSSSSSESFSCTPSPTQSENSSLSKTLSVNEGGMRQCTTPPPRLESLRKMEIPDKRPRRLTIGSVKYEDGESYKPPVIHQILLTMKQRRNIRDLINIIDKNIRNDFLTIEGDWRQRLDFLTLSPDSFVLIRDEDFLHTIGEEFMGYSCFTYAAKKRRIDILKMLCKAQPQKVYENILLDMEQLERIIETKDCDVIKILITALQFHIENERNHILNNNIQYSTLKIGKSSHNEERDDFETESFIRKYVARNFISIDNVNAVKVILDMNLVSAQIAAKIAVTMSKINTLRFLFSKDALKPNDYFDGGNVLHWAVLNRAQDVIQLVCSLRATNKGHRVNVKRSNTSILQSFNGMTAFEIAKSVYNENNMSEQEKLICEHLQPTKSEFIKGVVDIVVHKVIH